MSFIFLKRTVFSLTVLESSLCKNVDWQPCNKHGGHECTCIYKNHELIYREFINNSNQDPNITLKFSRINTLVKCFIPLSTGIMAEEFKKSVSTVPELTKFVKSVLSTTSRTTKQISQLSDVVQYKDIFFCIWKVLVEALSEINDDSDTFMLNVLELLEIISLNKAKEGEMETEKKVWGLRRDPQRLRFSSKVLNKYIRKVWQLLVNREMSSTVHKKLLLVLLEFYISKLENPIFLTDFFMASMNVKGIISILGLQGVATLMQKHNIEYPNVYGKLYTLFEPSIFQSKYKSRLFYLANIFLSSITLPEMLVASFAKKSSRLSLSCAAPDCIIIMRFVGNLLIRHTGLMKMIHHPQILEVPEDPFLDDESDPMKTRANESSLWELSLLQNHCQPSVAAAAKFIQHKLPSLEYDLSEVLDNTYEKLFEAECRRTKKIHPSLTFHRPQETIAKLKDDQVYKLWSLTN